MMTLSLSNGIDLSNARAKYPSLHFRVLSLLQGSRIEIDNFEIVATRRDEVL